nr:TonB-dependent receptor [Verminephrobacter aporrectodeae]
MHHTTPLQIGMPSPACTTAAMLLALTAPALHAQTAAAPAAQGQTLSPVTVNASADASAQGLSPAYAGGQVARGGRAGVLGTRDALQTPFSITSYTNELIQDRHARSVGDVLQNDPTVRTARGFGNFQEAYFIRGFILYSDDIAYNGLYSLLPRQYIATELFERVELLRGASVFLNGASPGGSGLGGSINLVPKRAPNEPLNRVTLGVTQGGQTQLAADMARRFGPDGSTGVRLNAATRAGGSAVDKEKSRLELLALGLDWRSPGVRLSGDVGWQTNALRNTRTNVLLEPALTQVPRPPDNRSNHAQPGTYANERDLFGTLRGEWDLSAATTAWAAAGARRGAEANALANLTVNDAGSGAASHYRFDNRRRDSVNTGELGLRGKLQTGGLGHEWVAVAAYFGSEAKNAYASDGDNPQAGNLYGPITTSLPDFGAKTQWGGDLAHPRRTGSTRLSSLALGDTVALAERRLQLTAGLRLQKMETVNYAYGTAAFTGRDQQSHGSPLLAALYQVDPQLSVYSNYVEGLNQGQTAPTGATNQGQKLPPFVARQKEAGLKYDAGRIAADLALFSITRPRAFVDTRSRIFGTYGQDRHRGAELSLHGQASRELSLLGGLTWLDARQQSTGSASTDGRRVIGVPRLQANLGAQWELPGLPGLAVDGRLVHTGASYANATNTLKVPGWSRLDVGVRYLREVQGRLVTLRARVDNLTNRSYWASSGGYPGWGYLVLGAPRTLSISASVDF